MNRRALSPIVAVVLMFALITAAIGISLVYMLPNITKFKDKSYNNSNNLYFTALDSAIQDLIEGSAPSSSQFLFVQEEGTLQLDFKWNFIFLLKDITGAQTSLLLQDNVSRITHRSTATADYEIGEHRYIVGPENQDYLFLNGSHTVYNDIAVVNSSRAAYESTYLELALYYRYSLITEYETTASEEIYHLDIIHVKFVLEESTLISNSQKYINMKLTYQGTEKQNLGTIGYFNDVQGEITLLNQYNYRLYEYPIYFPANPSYTTHSVVANLINIIVGISLS
ncbi:hypothetical protein EU534_02235 [Candidatus Heimdallarchaeota archaeon]|nr:MAG: hypothetical protein EU534_02235 [Candidatus Heimdallarchaeota archaeon]